MSFSIIKLLNNANAVGSIHDKDGSGATGNNFAVCVYCDYMENLAIFYFIPSDLSNRTCLYHNFFHFNDDDMEVYSFILLLL